MATKPNTLFDMFTATPQLKPNEERREAVLVKKDSGTSAHILRMEATAKIFEARALFYEGIAFMHRGSERRTAASRARQKSALIEMMSIIESLIATKVSGRTEIAERRKLIREAGRAIGGSDVTKLWQDAESRWLKALEA